MNAIDTGRAGLNAALTRLEAGSSAVARGGVPAEGDEGSADRVRSMVEVRIAARDAQANAKVIERADEALGSLLDIRA